MFVKSIGKLTVIGSQSLQLLVGDAVHVHTPQSTWTTQMGLGGVEKQTRAEIGKLEWIWEELREELFITKIHCMKVSKEFTKKKMNIHF